MLTPSISFAVVGLLGFALSRLALGFSKVLAEHPESYKWYRDTSVFLALLLFGGMSAIFYNAPDMYDVAAPVAWYVLPAVFLTAGLLYVVFWFEIVWLTRAAVLAASVLLACMLPSNCLIFEGLVPLWADRILASLAVFVFVSGAEYINLLAGVFGVQAAAISAGIGILALLGGAPLYLGAIGVYAAGVWLGFLNLNWFPSKVYINSGTCMAAAYVSAWMLLQGAAELAGPSVLILAMFFFSEIIWAVAQKFVFGQNTVDLSENTACYEAFSKGVAVPAIGVAVAKINVVNVILAMFQLYSANSFSVPIFAFLINLWLLGILYNANEGVKSLKEANKDFVRDVKSGIDSIKKSFNKNKD